MIKPNSIAAGLIVYRFYLEKTGNPTKALKEYKGIETKHKMWIVYKVQRVQYEVKQQYKKEYNGK